MSQIADIAIMQINPDLSCVVLDCFDCKEGAIHYLTNYINEQYDLKNTNLYKVYQKSNVTFEVYQIGYLCKSLLCKYHIVDLIKPKDMILS